MKFGDFRRNFGQCPMALFDEEAGSVGEWSTVTFRKGATAGDVRAAAQQLFAIPAEHATVAKVTTTSFLKDFPLDDDASLADCNLYSNSDLVVRDGRREGEGTEAALGAALKSNKHSTKQPHDMELGRRLKKVK